LILVRQIAELMRGNPNQRRNSLGGVAGDGAIEYVVREQKFLSVGSELGKQAVCAVGIRLANEQCLNPTAAPDGLFEHANTLRGAAPVVGQLRLGEGASLFLDKGVLATGDAAQLVVESGLHGFLIQIEQRACTLLA
jgi:hypothetical protein